MTSYAVRIPLIAPVPWRDLQPKIDNTLQQLLKLDSPLNSSGGVATVVEPWKSWLWRDVPEGNVSWNPLPWFEGEIDDETFATTAIFNTMFGRVNLTLMGFGMYDRGNEILSVIIEPAIRPLASYDAVFAIAVALTIAHESESFVLNDYGLCGPYGEMTWSQVMEIARCQQPHSKVENAVNEVVDNLRRSLAKRGKQPLL